MGLLPMGLASPLVLWGLGWVTLPAHTACLGRSATLPRFCDYQIKRGGGAASDAADLLAGLGGGEGDGEGGARGLLQSKLAALQVGAVGQERWDFAAVAMGTVGSSWPGAHSCRLHNTRSRLASLSLLLGASSLAPRLRPRCSSLRPPAPLNGVGRATLYDTKGCAGVWCRRL